jgi:uncharacterized membrane protein (DUF106 family)
MIDARIDFRSDEQIYEMKWNAMKILDDVEEMMSDKMTPPLQIALQMLCPCFPFLQRFF